MALNAFEGARRIAKLIAGVGCIWYCGFVILDSPYVVIWYSVDWPGSKPVLVKDYKCPDSKTDYRSGVPTSSGKEVNLTFCFIKQIASDGTKLVFYKAEGAVQDVFTLSDLELDALAKSKTKARYLGNTDYSTEVTEYTGRVIQSFAIPQEDEAWIEAQWWSKRWKGIRDATLGLLGGLAALWAFTWATGWIVRGFMGIPRGLDRRD